MKKGTTQVAFRFEDDLLKQINRYAKRTKVTRADAVRNLVIEALSEYDDGGTVEDLRMMPSKNKTEVLPWHKPKCSHCRKPIEHINHAHAGWRQDEKGRYYEPVVVHTGSFCPYYLKHAPEDIQDLPIDSFRRCPMEAVKIALRRRGTRDERGQWAIWLSVVLGLPFSTGDLIMHAVENTSAGALPDRVPTLAEMSEGDDE